jgi:L-2,4-diaminobutyrate decarboxylase
MSIETSQTSFNRPEDAARTYRLLRQILREVFQPQSPFVPPSETSSLALDQPQGASIYEVLSEVKTSIVAHAINNRHRWTLAHMVPPSALISVVADVLISAMNECAFIWEEAPLAAVVEAESIRWMLGCLGLKESATGLLTSGGTMSNCLATYLAIKRAQKWRLSEDHARYCIMVSDQAHFSVDKAAAITGHRPASVIRVPTDSHGRLRPGELHRATINARQAGLFPFLFVCTAGTTNAGVLEETEEFLTAARSCRAWCHIDAAHGGMMCLSKYKPPSVSQWAEADSVSWDPHKSLYVSYAIGSLLLKDQTSRAPLEFYSEYALKNDDDSPHAGAGHLEGSRRFEALKLWMTIKHFGAEGFTELIDHTLQLAKEFASRIRAAAEFILLTEPDTNIVCFRIYHPELNDEALDAVNTAVQKQLFQAGGPLISTTRINGRVVLRVVLLNPLLEVCHLSDILERIRTEAHRQTLLALSIEGVSHESTACYQSAS